MQKIRDYSEFIASSRVALLLLLSSIIISLFLIIPSLPYAVGQNLLDLKFGFERDDVGFAFSILGEKGRQLHIFVSLILDTIFPIIYVSFHLGIYQYSNYRNNFVYLIPILTGMFDLMENVQCAIIMNITSIDLVTDQQIFLASSTNQIKWILVSIIVTIAIFPLFKNSYKKLRKSFLRRFLFLINKEKFMFKLHDVTLSLDLKDSIDREIFFNGYYEEDQIAYLKNSIRKYEITHFIDVGANIGVYSLSVAKTFPHIKIFAFEPHIGAFERMKVSVSKNNMKDNIDIYNMALGDKDGEARLFTLERYNTSQSGGARLSEEGQYKITQKRGDSLISLRGKNLAIKIDVEEFELNVLHGITELIRNNNIFLQIEIFDEKFSAVSSFLDSHNFKFIQKSNYTHGKEVSDYFYVNF